MARRYNNETVTGDSLTKKRIGSLLIIFSLLIITLIFRVGYWQIIEADNLRIKAQDQWTKDIVIYADRGDILDTNGNPLAVSNSSNTIVLQPGIILEKAVEIDKYNTDKYIDSLAQDLASILNMNPANVKSIALKDDLQVILKHSVTDDQAEEIRSLVYEYTEETEDGEVQKRISYTGIIVREGVQRSYPMGAFLSQVLGFVSTDGVVGIEGIEARFNDDLVGENGKLTVETDLHGIKIPDAYEQRTEPEDGEDLQLTIDATLQSFAESALEKCMYEQLADSATCIVMDPNTGAILAMANKPDYDNNEPPRYNIDILREVTRNNAINTEYEVGAAFGLFTAVAALDSGAVTMNTQFDCTGHKTVDEQEINCCAENPHGILNIVGALQQTCSCAYMDMALSVGSDTFYDYIYNFGFGSKTGIKLYSEASGNVIHEKYIQDDDLARMGFGQTISVTHLQTISAVSAIANGGKYMQPYIVERLISPDGSIKKEFYPQVVNEVITEYTSDLMLQIMLETVNNGSGRNCRIEGYQIGGKASTVQKYDDEGNVMDDQYIASFVAVAPIDDPQLVVLVVVDEPIASSNYGSVVAAPYVKDFLEEALPYLNILPNAQETYNNRENMVPDLVGLTLEEAQKELDDEGFGCIIEGFDGKIVTQIPGAGTLITIGENVVVQLEQVSDNGESDFVEVPDLFGLSPTEAMEVLAENNLTMRIVTSGNIAMEQYPSEGTEVYRGSQVAVEFEYFENKIEEELEN